MKIKGRPVQVRGNVVMFPNLEERLLSKAMALLEEKRYEPARERFGNLLEINLRNVRALYGWAVCSIELGDYQQAEEAITLLLEEDTPYYYDVFRLYLTILIERKDYKAALYEIEMVGNKNDLPQEFKNFLDQMEKFCRIRMDEPSHHSENRAISLDESGKRADKPGREKMSIDWPALEKANTKDQLLLIHNLADRLRATHLPEIKRFLLDEKQHTEIKTMLLCAVKEGNLAKEIPVRKFGHIYHAHLESDEFLNKHLADEIERTIRKKMDSDNPTLANLAVEMERMFTMNVYPKPVSPNSAHVWAAVFCLRALAVDTQDEKEKVLDQFGVKDDDYQCADRFLREIETYGLWD